MAPEVFKDLLRSRRSDIYSYSIVVWEILHRMTPFAELKTHYAIMTAVADGKRPKISVECSDRHRWIMENGWYWDYHQRPTIDDILTVLEADECRLKVILSLNFYVSPLKNICFPVL